MHTHREPRLRTELAIALWVEVKSNESIAPDAALAIECLRRPAAPPCISITLR
eukprot:COSAG06_NODE_45663_length_353_cov_0.606299_1_plen_52_part_01